MNALRAGNLALKFMLELSAIAALCYWASGVLSGTASILLILAVATVTIVAWGYLAAPKATHRLALHLRVPFELSVFGLSAMALWAAGSRTVAILLAALVTVNALLLTVLGQWEY